MHFRAFLAATLFSVVGFTPHSSAYSLFGSKWSTATITMQLQLGAGSGVLLDGFSSWGASAEDALFTWNSHISSSKFAVVRDSTAPKVAGNRLNNVFFSDDVNGQAWGTGVLAVTIIYTSGGTSQTETDVLFNNRLSWNSYRGPLRAASSGGTLHDFHRVALHEFGHALGLDHPDEKGQSVSALMNSRVSALDALTSDDIAGGQSLYGPAVAVVAPPVITTHPTSRSVLVGQSTTFSVVANSTAAMTYRWTKSGATIIGATGATYTLASAVLTDAASYAVVVSNSAGSVTSTAATLAVTSPVTPTPPPPTPPPPTPPPPTVPTPPPTPAIAAPAILVAPASQSVNAGNAASFYVVTSGTAPLSYQWRKDGVTLPGATGSTLSIPNLQASHAGNYNVTVSNAAGSVTSTAAALTVHALPVIVTPPADQTIAIGERLRLSVVASGTSLSYAWRKDGAALPGASTATYEIAAAQVSHSGSYTAVVTSTAGSVTSAAARVAVVAVAPTVRTAPLAQTANAGEAVTFSVTANGTPPFTYQWFKDTQELPGATSATLSLNAVRTAEGGQYVVRISNAAGSIASSPAMLTVRSSRLVNLSTRAFVPAGGTLTPGFFIRGSGSKPLLIRAIGPTLRQFGVERALSATRLELIAQGSAAPLAREEIQHAITDNEAAALVGAFPLAPDARDAAVQTSLLPSGYTVRVSPGEAGLAGIALAEIYDADSPTSRAQLVNVSTLGFVGAGENVLTAGFAISGNASKRLLIRAVGPGLAQFGVGDTLPDPQLAVVRQGGAEPLAMNDNWPNVENVRAASTAAGAFSLPVGSPDAALVVTLEPGAYTVIVSSVISSVTGQALVEIYDLDP
jgi:hypothetical protein